MNSDGDTFEQARLADEIQRLRKENEQHKAELAIINSVQQGLAAKLDIQSIYDLVGDKIREIFPNTDTEIRIYDAKTNLIHFPYFIDDGERVAVDSIPLTESGISSYILRNGQTLVINENFMQEAEKFGSTPILLEGGHLAKSAVFVPLRVNNQARGLLVLGNVEREHAFSDADVRLFETLANSMSVALENARLFDETQHLLNETEQRAAELAIINSVQEGLASKLDVQAIYDLVGDKIRDIFQAQGTAIYLFDHKTEMLDTPYCYLKKRFEIESRPFSEHPIAAMMVDKLQPITYRTVEEYRALGGTVLENSEEYKSGMYVPLLVGKELKGMVGVANLDQENAYGDSDLRLLTILANSMSTALENARLFDEVQTKNAEITEALERETASNDILQVIAESPTDIQPVLEVIARNAAQLSGSDDAIITLRDGDILRVDAHYGEVPTFPAGEGMRFNRDSVAGRAILEGRPLQAIHNQQGVKSEYPEGDKVAKKYGYRMSCAVPLMRKGQAIGAISIRRLKPELLTEKHIALIQSFANQAALAVENVRLFNKTTRLLKETEQRAAELAIINSVQEGLASKLDMQAIYNLVGDKIREIFYNTDTEIRIYDPKTTLFHVTYSIENGQRVSVDPISLSDARISAHVLRTGQTLVINENFVQELEKYGAKMVLGRMYHPKSGVFVPLLVGNQAYGLIILSNVEREHAFASSDVSLLQTLANSMSTALENARLFDETQRLLKETEQRAAELAIINSVQEGLASKLDMQAIYDLVGDKIRDLFNAQSVWIQIYDQATRTRQFRYGFYRQRIYIPEALPFNKLTEHLITSKKPLVINQEAEASKAEFEMVIVPGSEMFKSAVFVPLIAGGEVKGVITLQNMEQEYAFSESDINLLSTLASSMTVALENARLFDETQRLFRLEQQRVAELAIINSVQSALAENLDIQAIYDIVGNKIQSVFNAQTVILMSYDESVSTIHYYVEKGERFYDEPIALSELHKTLIRTGKTLVFNENTYEELSKLGAILIPGSEAPRSAVFVPLMIGTRVFGVISLQNIDYEHAFTEPDVRLLETLASSMSVALENARLFDETQRLLNETEQRNAELAIINRVQEGLAEGVASKRDIQAIYDLVGDKICELFPNTDTEIRVYDPKTNQFYVPYYIENGQRVAVDPISLSEARISAHVLRTGQTLVINENIFQEMEKYGAKLMRGRRVPAKSVLFVPLMAGNQARGLIILNNVEREHAFRQSDVHLFQTLANSMSTALENARLFDETQRLLQETEQRAAELAIINSVQEGLVSKLDMQAIYDLVGDKIRDLFSAQSVWILTFDRMTRTRQVKYSFEKGQRFYTSELLPFNKLTEHLIATKKTLVINWDADARIAEFEMVSVAGTERAKSMIFVPLITDNEVKGMISLQNIEEENAFSESDISLLSTLASSMSVALENARLFDETQRLLQETEQRAAELAIINSVQEGLSSKLEMQAIYELVGDEMQEIFDAQSLLIVTFDHTNEMAHVTFHREQGTRYYAEPYPFSGLHRHLIQSRDTIVINENSREWQAKYGMVVLPGTDPAKSMIFVPLTSGYRVSGMISIQNLEREHAFSDTDVRLLETLAASISVALENASLFDETQRLLKETEQRAAELAIINSVQQTLSSKLEMQAIYELVGDKIQEIFSAQSLLIVTFDHSTEMAYVTYNRENGIRYYTEPYPFTGLNRYLIQSGRTLVINENVGEWQSKLGMILLPGTEIPKSTVFVPLNSGKGVSGFISLQNLEREHAFSEMDVRLLETLASSMSATIENASLFDESQRLFLEAKEARMAAEQANQAKSAFLSSMSHELRTPLNAIINFVEMVARGMIGPVNQEQVELLDQALDSSKHLLNLINDVLDISKIQAGQLTLFIEDQVSVQVEVEAALSIVGGLIQEKGLQLIRDVDPHFPMVSCDRRRVRQVLLNLISNAIKFTPKGTITVSVKNQGQEVLFAVIDTGPGIPRDKQDLIFEPFLQTENGERQMQGTGLGLPISRSLVRAHGGELWVDSQPGEGSAFFFTLPVERSGTS